MTANVPAENFSKLSNLLTFSYLFYIKMNSSNIQSKTLLLYKFDYMFNKALQC